MLQSYNLRAHRYEYSFLLVILGGFTFIAVTYSIITPTFEGPDEELHFQLIEKYSEGELNFDANLPEPLSHLIYSTFLKFIEYEKIDIPNNWPIKIIKESEVHNRYLHFEDEIFPFENTTFAVHLLRLVSIGIGCITLIFVFKIAKIIFPKSQKFQIFSVAFVAFMPKFIFMNSVLNTEPILILFSIIVIYYLLKFVKNQSYKELVLVSIFSGLAMATKITGNVLIIIVTISILLLIKKSKLNVLKYLGFFGLISVVSGGWIQIQRLFSRFDYQYLEKNPIAFFGESQRPPPAMSDIYHRTFETFWSNVGWGDTEIPFGQIEFIFVLMVISVIGTIMFVIKRYQLEFDKKQLQVILITVGVYIVSLFYFLLIYNSGNGRNILIIMPFLAIWFIISFIGLFKEKKYHNLLLIPIFCFVFFSVIQIPEIQEDLGYDFGNKFPYNIIQTGYGSEEMGGQYISVQHGLMEGEKEGIYLFMHPVDGDAFWTFTQNIEKIPKLKLYYGFAEGPIRTIPVEFQISVNGDKVFSEKKSYTCELNYVEIDLSNYEEKNVDITFSLNTFGDDYKAWSIWKPVLEKNEIDLIKPTHPSTHKVKWDSWYYRGIHPFCTMPIKEILDGSGSNPMNSLYTNLNYDILENDKTEPFLFLHPTNMTTTWWNFTYNVPKENEGILLLEYGFKKNTIREQPVEFSAFLDNSKLFSKEKMPNGKLEEFKINLEEYLGRTVEIALSTKSKGEDYYAWSIWKPTIQKNIRE